MKVIGTDRPEYQEWLRTVGTKINGACLYAKEIEQNILPHIKSDDTINTVAIILYAPDDIPDESVVVAHDNFETVTRYRAYFGKRIRWICSMESTRDKLLAPSYAECLKVKLTNRHDSIRTTEPGNKKKARINRMPIDTGTHATRR